MHAPRLTQEVRPSRYSPPCCTPRPFARLRPRSRGLLKTRSRRPPTRVFIPLYFEVTDATRDCNSLWSEHMSYEPNAPGERSARSPAAAEEPRGRTDELGGRAAGVGAKAAHTAEQMRATAAAGMDTASSKLHEGADTLRAGGRASSVAHSTADVLSSSADYIREHDLSDMMDDLMGVVKNNPGPALLGAVALGFLVGRAFSRD
jgi:hypothetical protein